MRVKDQNNAAEVPVRGIGVMNQAGKKSCSRKAKYRLEHRMWVQLIQVTDAEDEASVLALLEDRHTQILIQCY